jgi:integrase
VDGVVRLPSERTKNKQAFALPLSGLALGILEASPAGEWYFQAERGGPLTNYSVEKKALGRLCPEVAHWTLHDLRCTAATLLQRAGVLPHVIEACLNHKLGGVKGVYQRHEFIPEKREAMEALAALLSKIVEGSGPPGEGSSLETRGA